MKKYASLLYCNAPYNRSITCNPAFPQDANKGAYKIELVYIYIVYGAVEGAVPPYPNPNQSQTPPLIHLCLHNIILHEYGRSITTLAVAVSKLFVLIFIGFRCSD